MTRQKRVHLFILALVPVVVFAAVRCADSTATAPVSTESPALTAELQAKLARLHQENDWIGQFHNDALSFVFANLQRIPLKARNPRGVCETARKAYAEFHKTRRGTAVPTSVDAEFESRCSAASPGASSRVFSIAIPSEIARAEVTPAAQGLMDQIDYAIDASTSFGDLSAQVSSIEASAAANLSYEDASAVVAVGSVALSSADYWANNLTAWIPFTATTDYSVLLASRAPGDAAVPTTPAFGGNDGGWSSWASTVWNDAKQAAKRAAKGDFKAAVKVVIASGAAGAPIIYEVVIGSAAAGSILAVLEM